MRRYQSNYGNAHWTIVKNILKYLRRTKEASLVFRGEEELVVKGYSDASFETYDPVLCSTSIELEKFQATYYSRFNDGS
jgi:hypothetical protein